MSRSTKTLIMLLVFLIAAIPMAAVAASSVVVVPVKGAITQGLADDVCKEIDKANSDGARAVILEINTPGGFVDAAEKICDKVNDSKIPVVAYINKRAWSAGALIALSCPITAIAPGGSIGAAEPRPANEKTISALRAEFVSWAEKHNRNKEIAAGMVDKNVVISGIKEKDTILSLSAEQAREHGIADYIASDTYDLLKSLKMNTASVQNAEVKFDIWATIAQVMTNPWVSTILMTVGLICLILEILTLWSVWGSIGVSILALFFISHIASGHSPWWTILIFAAGLLLLILEIFVIPGWGVAGTTGLILTFVSMFIAIGDVKEAAISLAVSMTLSSIIFFFALKHLPKSKIWRKMTLETTQSSAGGYNSMDLRKELEGAVGVASTDLRPAGVALINEERIDVTTGGEFIKKETPVKVIKVEGMRIVVKEAEGVWS